MTPSDRRPILPMLALICTTAGAQPAPAADATAPAAAAAASAPVASPARGQRLFLRCASCHDIGGGAAGKIGPLLTGVVGRRVASVAGYGYSKSLAAQDFSWDEARLDTWLERPTAIAPGTTMAFEGLPAAADRQAVIAYLKTLRP